MLPKPLFDPQDEPKMVVLAPLLAHLGALGRHLGFNLVHLGAKLGAKRHLNGLSQKSFLKVFAGMASRTLPKIFQEAGGFRLGGFPLCFTSIFASGASRTRPRKVIRKCSQDGSKMVPSSSKKGLLGPMLVYLGAMLAIYGSKSALFGCILSLRLPKMVRR